MGFVKLVVGDWSHDGHEKTDDFMIHSDHPSFSGSEVMKAYNKAVSELNFDITGFCEDYEDNSIPLDKIKPVFDMFPHIRYELDYRDKSLVRMDSGNFTEIFVAMANHGNPELNISIVNFGAKDTLKIGGYGLFY